MFDSVEGRLMHVHRTAGKEKASVADFFNDAIDAREEGIIVKSAVSQYQVSDSCALALSIYLIRSFALSSAHRRTQGRTNARRCAYVHT